MAKTLVLVHTATAFLAPSFAPSFAPDDDASTGDERQSPTAAPTLEGMVEAERYAYIGGGLAGFLLIVCCVATAISRLRRDPEETDKRTSARALRKSSASRRTRRRSGTASGTGACVWSRRGST